MNAKLLVRCLGLGLACSLFSPTAVSAQTAEGLGAVEFPVWLPTGEIRKLLDQKIDMKEFQVERPLKEVLAQIKKALPKKAQQLHILIDEAAFREEEPDAPEVAETPIQFGRFPSKMSAGVALRLALSKVPNNSAALWFRSGQIVITTWDHVRAKIPASWINHVEFQKRPLHDALDELAEWSGATILLDPRVGAKAQTRVTARLHGCKVETAVQMLADMAGLKPVLVDNVIYVTTPENTRRFAQPTTLKFGSTISGQTYKSQPLSQVLADFFINFAIDTRIEKNTKTQ